MSRYEYLDKFLLGIIGEASSRSLKNTAMIAKDDKGTIYDVAKIDFMKWAVFVYLQEHDAGRTEYIKTVQDVLETIFKNCPDCCCTIDEATVYIKDEEGDEYKITDISATEVSGVLTVFISRL